MKHNAANESNVDSITRRVLGTGLLLNRATPRSDEATEKWKQLDGSIFSTLQASKDEFSRLRQLDAAVSDRLLESIDTDLKSLPTLERPIRRLDAGETLRDADFFELKRFCYHAVSILQTVDGLDELPPPDSEIVKMLGDLMETLHPGNAWSRRFHLADELDPELEARRSKLRQVRRDLKSTRSTLEADMVSDYGGSFDIHGRYRPSSDATPDDERLTFLGDGRYRIDDPHLTSLEKRYEQLRDQVSAVEDQQRRRLTDVVAQLRDQLIDLKGRLVDFDLRITRIELRRTVDGCWPRISEDNAPFIDIEQGRDPMLFETVAPEDVQPVDVVITEPGTVVLGPNMGGKSSLLRLLGLVCWCARKALPVPAKSCRIASFERIVYVGSEAPHTGQPTKGLSSFGREIRRFVDYWQKEGPILWLLDEPCRGTHPDEGARLAATISDQRIEDGDTVVMATHFPALAQISDFARLRIAGLTVDEQTLRKTLDAPQTEARPLHERLQELMNYRVVKDDDGTVPRDGWRIARALGLDIPPPQ